MEFSPVDMSNMGVCVHHLCLSPVHLVIQPTFLHLSDSCIKAEPVTFSPGLLRPRLSCILSWSAERVRLHLRCGL